MTALALFAPGLAVARDFTPTAQDRSASWTATGTRGTYVCSPPPTRCSPVNVTPIDDGNSLAAADFAPFAASLDGIVDHDSLVDPKRLSATGSHSATAIMAPLSQVPFYEITFDVESQSVTSVDFDLTEATPYHLAGEIAATTLNAESLARIRLTGPGGTIAEIELSADGSCVDLGTETLDQSGTLAPGSYTRLAEVDGHAFSLIAQIGGTHTGSFDVTLTLDPVTVPTLGLWAPLLIFALGAIGAWTARRAYAARDRPHS